MNITNGTTIASTTAASKLPLPFPFYNEAAITLLFFSIYVTDRFFSKVIKTSPLLGQLLAGILLGPACLNIIPFVEAFQFFGKLGVMLLVVESGLATDIKRVVKFGGRSFLAAFLGVIAPVLLAVGGGALFFGAAVRVGLAAGSAIAPTSLGFSAKLLGTEGLQTNLGSIIAISAVIDDVLSLCLLEIVRALKTAVTPWDYLRPMVASLGSIVVGLFVVWVTRRMELVRRVVECSSSQRQRSSSAAAHKDDWVYLLLLTLVSIGLGWACAAVGSSDLLGCFLGGLALSGSKAKESFARRYGKITKIATSLFFACTVGFGVPSLLSLFSLSSLSRGAYLLLAALVGKAFVGFLAIPLTTFNFFKFSIAMQGRGEFSFLIADIAKSEGVLDNEWHAGCIWACVLASLVAPFGFRYVLGREKEQTKDESKEITPREMEDVRL